jgi:hypothetical protein
MTTYVLWDGIDCGLNARPVAQLWKEAGEENPRWGYSLDTGTGDDTLVIGFESEEAARMAAQTYVHECMADSAAEAAGGDI